MTTSIIIPTLNEEAHISGLLEFLDNHKLRSSFEVIVVDGGSTDRTVQIIEQHDCKLLKTKKHSRAHQMNIGASQAQGKILHFVHADVQLQNSFLDRIYEALSQGYQAGCFRYKFQNPTNPLLKINAYFTRFPFSWCRGGDQTLFLSKALFGEIGGFDERFVIMEDYEILERLEDYKFRIIPSNILVSARKYATNSYFKVQWTNLQAMRMYKRREDPIKISLFYDAALNREN